MARYKTLGMTTVRTGRGAVNFSRSPNMFVEQAARFAVTLFVSFTVAGVLCLVCIMVG